MSSGQALRLRPRSLTVLLVVSAIGVLAFGWPFVLSPESTAAHSSDAPWLFALLLPFLLLVVVASLLDGAMDAKAVALLGVLSAVGAGLRVIGTGAGGVEPVFVLLVLAGRALGPGFGFALGQLTLLASALVTGGVGPWLPFQMIVAGWIALGAGLLPRVRGWGEIALVALYGAVAGVAYGGLINLWFWPFLTATTEFSFIPGASVPTNLAHYVGFWATTSLAWDLVRAALTATLCLIAGKAVLQALRRAARKANFADPAHEAQREQLTLP